MSHWKFLPALVFLIISTGPLPAQWESGPWPNASSGMGMCTDIEVRVRDSMGVPVTGAAVTLEDNGSPFTTDAQGLAAVPCYTSKGFMTRMEIRAPGYQASRVVLPPGFRARLEVTLNKRESAAKAAGTTIGAQELYETVQTESRELQNQASAALHRNDYDMAERLLVKAQQLTPSVAGIANNLGIVAMHRNDLNAAASLFEKAIQMAPRQADMLSNLGLVRWMQRQTEESYKLLREASAMGYETGLGNYILGTVGLGKGLSKEAAKRLKKSPSDRFPYRDLYLSMALRNLGKNKAADETYQKFLLRNPAPYLQAGSDRRKIK
jgi:tetratricopeptide (TPR) repeat protein